jgi:hypothetical protein
MHELTPTERAARLAYWLTIGRPLNTAVVAESFGVSARTAQRLFVSVSRVLPAYRDDDGNWTLCDGAEGSISLY